MSNEEFQQQDPHTQSTPAQTPLAAQNVRRRRNLTFGPEALRFEITSEKSSSYSFPTTPAATAWALGTTAYLAGTYLFGWIPALLCASAAGFLVGIVWFLVRDAAAVRTACEDEDYRTLIRGEAALRRRVAALELVASELASRAAAPAAVNAGTGTGGSPYVVGYLAGVRRRLAGSGSSGPASRTGSRRPDQNWG